MVRDGGLDGFAVNRLRIQDLTGLVGSIQEVPGWGLEPQTCGL